MKKKTTLIITYLLVLFTIARIEASQINDSELHKGIKSQVFKAIAPYINNHAFEGNVLVVESGQIIFNHAFGFKDHENNQQLTKDTPYPIASLSKPITATLILKLAELGKLNLDSPLTTYFPEFDATAQKLITIRHLLANRSGIPNHFRITGWFDKEYHNATSEAEFVSTIANLPLAFPPGSDYLYSNPGYFLLGKIAEKVTGDSLANILRQYVLSPLKLKNTELLKNTNHPNGLPKGYQWQSHAGYRQQATHNMKLFGAGAAIFSTTHDLAKLDSAWYDSTLLTLSSKAILFDRSHPLGWRVEKWQLADNLAVNVHNYDGQIDAYSSMLTRFIDSKHTVILLSNVGTSFQLKKQITTDIAKVLHNLPSPNRNKDAELALINALVSGKFKIALADFKAHANNYQFTEKGLTSLAYQLLWSNLAQYALPLFKAIQQEFPNSSNAVQNFNNACQHRLAKQEKANFCQ